MAGRDITVGEVISVEKAIVSHMLPEYMGKLGLKYANMPQHIICIQSGFI